MEYLRITAGPIQGLDVVLCENSADVGLPDHWRIDAAGEGVCLRKFGRIAIVLEPAQRLGQASAMDPLPPPLAFFVLLFSGWVNRQQQAVMTICSRRIGCSARRTDPDVCVSPTTSAAAWR